MLTTLLFRTSGQIAFTKNMNEINATDREMFKRVIESFPKIRIEKITADGEVSFTVPLSELSITKEQVMGCSLGNTKFFANFVGELLVRENMGAFSAIIWELDSKSYDSVVTGYQHENFGMFLSRDIVRFQFHVSLIEDILNEDVVRLI